MRQGDPLSANLFNCILEKIFRGLNWEGKGLKINGEWLHNIHFADDVVITAKNTEELSGMVREIMERSKRAGLELNFNKTKIIGTGEPKNINVGEKEIEEIKEIIYLEQVISFKNKGEKKLQEE